MTHKISRRDFLKIGTLGVASGILAGLPEPPALGYSGAFCAPAGRAISRGGYLVRQHLPQVPGGLRHYRAHHERAGFENRRQPRASA